MTRFALYRLNRKTEKEVQLRLTRTRQGLSNGPSTKVLRRPQRPQNGDQNVLNGRILVNFDNKGRKVCCKVSLYKNCQRQSCRAFNCLSSGINILVGGRLLDPEILPPCEQPSPVNGILWELSELITQERIAVGSSNFVEGLST